MRAWQSRIRRRALITPERADHEQIVPLSPNTDFARYKVISRLGAGGMGEVYSAQDTQLERTVALKVLHAEVAADEGRMRRFTQEAKAAAALNHPHIAHIYEIGDAGGTKFMAMELIEGDTLRHKIHRDHASLKRLLEWLTQVAEGLAKAHAAGIVHRDLKPDNIMVSRDGYAKILDFGLAKLVEPQQPTGSQANPPSEIATAILAQPLSTPGMIMGTVGYMSPEQARGQTKIDGRSDIFSFGCILYEAITKQKPFAGETVVDSLHNIIHEQPPPIKNLNAALSSDLQRIVRRCLAKDPEDRFQTIKDVATELKELRRDMESTVEVDRSISPEASSDAHASQTADRSISPTVTAAVSTAEASIHSTSSAQYIAGEIQRHKRGVIIGAIALVLAIGAVMFAIYRFWRPPARNRAAIKIEKLTTNGKSSDAAISPDGKYVVYVLNEGRQQSLWTRQVATTSNVQIIPPSEERYLALSFTPDSNYINFVRTEKSNLNTLYQMPLLGGTQKKLFSDADGAVSYSPDARQFAYVRGNFPNLGESALLVANADGTGERVLALRKRPETFPWWREQTPVWSTDGRSITCVTGGDATGSGLMNLVEVQVADGTLKPLPAPGWYEVRRIAGLPDNAGFLVLGADKPSAYYAQQLWHVAPEGDIKRITTDLNNYVGMSVTVDGSALVAVQSNRISNIWVAPNGDASKAIQVKSGGSNQDGTDGLAFTSDNRIVFYSRASGADDIWIINSDGSGLQQLTVDVGTNYDLKVTPDNRFVVFTSERSGQPNVWRMDLAGGNAKQLSNGNSDFGVAISPDSKWVVYESTSSGKPALWKVSIDGGNPVKLTDYAAENPEISPDGKFIACQYREDVNSSWRYAIIPFDGGKPLKVFDFPSTSDSDFRWTPDGRSLAYLDSRGGVSNIWSFPLDGSPPRQLTDFKSDQIYNFKWSADGKQLVLARGNITSDVVLIRDFR